MHKNCLRQVLLTGIMLVSLSAVSQPPYKIEKVISENKIVGFNDQKLLIIDFWATWCAPCAPATEQLEILQEVKPDDVFIVSVSDEREETISSYLLRNPIRLAVVRDYLPNSMINFFKIRRRPYSVLLSLDGKILYQGHPSNITTDMIEQYASQMKSKPRKNWSDLFVEVHKASLPSAPLPKNKAPLSVQPSQISPQTDMKMYIQNGVFFYSGPLSGLIRYLTDCSSYQIEFNDIEDNRISISCSESELANSKSAILQFIEKRLSLNIQIENKEVEVYVLDVFNPKRLWDNKQINWGTDLNHIYIVGPNRVEADNISLKEVADLLSELKENSYYYKGNDTKLYDWIFHYHYDDLMTEDLESNFGIKLKKEKVILPIYKILPSE